MVEKHFSETDPRVLGLKPLFQEQDGARIDSKRFLSSMTLFGHLCDPGFFRRIFTPMHMSRLFLGLIIVS